MKVRQKDPEWSEEHLKREVNPALWDLQLGWGTKRLSVRGLAIVLLLGVAAVIVSNVYAANDLRRTIKEIASTTSVEHRSMVSSNERLACIVSLTLEDRKALRVNYYQGAFARYCPWMQTE